METILHLFITTFSVHPTMTISITDPHIVLPTRVNLTPSDLEKYSNFNLTWHPQDSTNLVNYSVEVFSFNFSYRIEPISSTSHSVVVGLNSSTLYNISILLSACSKENRTTFLFSKFIVGI